MQYVTYLLASLYGQGTYDSSTYQIGPSASSSSGSVLTNTGFDIALVVTLACTLALIAVLVRFWRRPGRREPNLPAE